jgi:hypothetical protein
VTTWPAVTSWFPQSPHSFVVPAAAARGRTPVTVVASCASHCGAGRASWPDIRLCVRVDVGVRLTIEAKPSRPALAGRPVARATGKQAAAGRWGTVVTRFEQPFPVHPSPSTGSGRKAASSLLLRTDRGASCRLSPVDPSGAGSGCRPAARRSGGAMDEHGRSRARSTRACSFGPPGTYWPRWWPRRCGS